MAMPAYKLAHRALRPESTRRGANKNMRLSKAMDGFLDDCRSRGLSAHTVSGYEGDLRHLISLATVTSADSINGFTEDLVSAYFKVCLEKGNLISTRITKRAAVIEFARYCLRKRYLALDPTVNAPEFKLPHRLPKPYTNNERAKLMALTETEHLRERRVHGTREKYWVRVPLPPAEAVLRGLLYHAGMRVGTAVNVRLNSLLEAENGSLGNIRVIAKGDREVLLPIVPELDRLLNDYILEHTDMQPNSFLLSRRHGQPWTVRMAQRAVTGWGRAAAVVKATSHRFRHTVGKETLETGATLEETQAILGHANISTTQIYRRITNKAAGEAALRRAQLLRPSSGD